MKEIEKSNYWWVSPEGEAIPCDHEDQQACKILMERYSIERPNYDDATKWLLQYGWMCYRHDLDLGRGWMILKSRKPIHLFYKKYGMIPTEAQKDKILELEGIPFDDSMVVWEFTPS